MGFTAKKLLLGSSRNKSISFTASASTGHLSTLSELRYLNDRFVIVYDNSAYGVPHNFYYSYDGITWNFSPPLDAQITQQPLSMTYGNGKFVAIHSDSDGGGNVISDKLVSYSSDFINWNTVDMNSTEDPSNPYYKAFLWQKIAYGNGRFVAVGIGRTLYDTAITLNGIIFYSDDAINWYPAATYPDVEYRHIAYGNGRFVTGFTYSLDGINWNSIPNPINPTSIIYANNEFYATTETNVSYLYKSSDGINWNLVYSFSPTTVDSFVYGNGIYMYGKTYDIYYSKDLSFWYKTRQLPVNGFEYKFSAFGNQRFVFAQGGGSGQTRIYSEQNPSIP